MQFFRFIFLARSWAKDRALLGEHIVDVAEHAKAAKSKLSLVIFPEGTLVSKDTRPLSKKYADKCGIVSLPSFRRRIENANAQLPCVHL
jgi:1-acyl-sn-glycerol-3-phosphate acyltransferase